MRVICINNKPIEGYANHNLQFIKEGQIYTVEHIHSITSALISYTLNEVKTNSEYGYAAIRFIECSELDELELVNELVLVEK